MDELELISRLLPYMSAAGGDLVIGAGADDAAAWRNPDGTFTVASCDASVEGVHFDLERQEPDDVGWRALAFALGDLAAKGARPTYGLVSLSMPVRWSVEIPEGIYRGMSGLATEVGLRLVGGDTTRAPADGVLNLALLGTTSFEPRARASVKSGWEIGVSGPLGGSSLEVRRPRPRLALGTELAAAGLVCGDISDGLVREHDKIARMTGIGARLSLERVPVAPGASAEQALASGEEVELVCWGRPPLPSSLSVVGTLTDDGRVVVVDAAGVEVDLRDRGYDHFA